MGSPALVLVKRFTYRNAPEEWSNKYHFSDSAPADGTAWKALADAVGAQEKTIYSNATHIVRAYGYTDGDQDSVWSYDYTAAAAEIVGTLVITGGKQMPGDTATWVRWATTKRNSKGKTVYLRKYYHDAFADNAIVPDNVLPAQKTALLAFGQKLQDGTITGFHYCGHDGTDAGAVGVSAYLTTRTLKRRGKRPPS